MNESKKWGDRWIIRQKSDEKKKWQVQGEAAKNAKLSRHVNSLITSMQFVKRNAEHWLWHCCKATNCISQLLWCTLSQYFLGSFRNHILGCPQLICIGSFQVNIIGVLEQSRYLAGKCNGQYFQWKLLQSLFIAKLSPSFSFSWAELALLSVLYHPATRNRFKFRLQM